MRRKTEKKACRGAGGRADTGPARNSRSESRADAAGEPPETEPADPEEAAPDDPEPEEEPAPGQEAGEPAAGEDTSGTQPPQQGPDSRIADLERQLLDARCRLAAFAAGVAPDLVEDAVTLAVQAARADGQVTEESVTAALGQVLQRHPRWKADRRPAGGFRLGADAEDTPRRPAPAQTDRRRWNRFR